jgi:hypothetical protein
MRTRVDDRLREEAARFSFRFACDDCAHFDPGAARCSLGYPAEPRRDALSHPFLELCKEFDLA